MLAEEDGERRTTLRISGENSGAVKNHYRSSLALEGRTQPGGGQAGRYPLAVPRFRDLNERKRVELKAKSDPPPRTDVA